MQRYWKIMKRFTLAAVEPPRGSMVVCRWQRGNYFSSSRRANERRFNLPIIFAAVFFFFHFFLFFIFFFFLSSFHFIVLRPLLRKDDRNDRSNLFLFVIRFVCENWYNRIRERRQMIWRNENVSRLYSVQGYPSWTCMPIRMERNI